MRLRIRLIYFLYRAVLALAFPLVLVYLLLRVFRTRGYAKTLPQRLGVLPESFCQRGPGAVWIHAVSVGEVLCASTLIGSLKTVLPGTQVFLSTSTLAGYTTACTRLNDQAAGVFYAPLDTPFAIRRVLRTLQPSLVVVLETEIWPNLFREVKRAGCGLLIANGRISDKAVRSYRRWRWFFRSVLAWPDTILVQSNAMCRRLVECGAPADRTIAAGNLKYDAAVRELPAGSPISKWLEVGTGPVLIAASTTEDAAITEEAIVLDAFLKLDGWRLILAPRKPDRFEQVAKLLEARQVPFRRRSDGDPELGSRVLLLDTMGELASIFTQAAVVFMGGTLTTTEGHNLLEPALAGCAMVSGPRVANFLEIAEDLRSHNAVIWIERPEELHAAILQAYANPDIGAQAKRWAEAHRGAVDRVTNQARSLYARSLYFPARLHRGRLWLAPLAALWAIESSRRVRKRLREARGLSTPVVSIGNITAGGTGKTPTVMRLAARLREQGLEPVTLSRGHGRSSHRGQLILPRGSQASELHTGDEPQMLLRSGDMGLGIGADRYKVGLEAQKTLRPDVFLLDDGFSHVQLRRDLDIVLIDALDPFGRGATIPLGRLREPMSALSRAEVFILTRCAPGLPLEAIEFILRIYNERAPIFYSHLKPGTWQSLKTGLSAIPPERTIAFCGLGNPQSFWITVEKMGVHPIDRLRFSDHFKYGTREWLRLIHHARAVNASALLTTQKDLINIFAGAEQMLGDLDLLWLPVDTVIENETALMELVSQACIQGRRG